MASPARLLTALRRFGLEHDRFDAIVARRVGAPPVEFKAMDHLVEADELTPTQLGDRLALTSGAVTALLDRLERLGWVTREPHPHDRRSVVVRKVAAAESEGMELYAPFATALGRAAGRLTAKERETVVRFLEDAAAAAHDQAERLKRAG